MPLSRRLPPSLWVIQEFSWDAADHPPKLEPRAPITPVREGKATNQTPAMKRTHLHHKMGRGSRRKHRKKQQNRPAARHRAVNSPSAGRFGEKFLCSEHRHVSRRINDHFSGKCLKILNDIASVQTKIARHHGQPRLNNRTGDLKRRCRKDL